MLVHPPAELGQLALTQVRSVLVATPDAKVGLAPSQGIVAIPGEIDDELPGTLQALPLSHTEAPGVRWCRVGPRQASARTT